MSAMSIEGKPRKTIQTDIQQLYKSLLDQQAKPRGLNAEGQKLLQSIEGGALANAEFSTFLQGVSYNSSDELFGKMRSTFPGAFGSGPQDIATQLNSMGNTEYSPYNVATELERGTVRDYREENPYKAFGLEAGGGVLTGGPAGLARTTGKALGTAAVSGAISAYNAGEGDSGSEQLGDATLGAGISMGVTGALRMAKGPFSSLYNAAFKSGTKEATREGQTLARRKMIETLQDSGMTPEEAIFELADASGKNFNRSMSLADTNENTRALIDAVSTLPGPGKETAKKYLRMRQEGRPGRLGTILEEAFGQKANFFNDFQALKEARSRTANILYGEANKVTVPMTKELEDMFRTPAMRDAFRKGMRISENNRQTGAMKFILTDDGRITAMDGSAVDGVDTIFLHYMKMGLDDVAFPTMPATGIGASEVQAIRGLRTEFLDYIDNANPAYKRARDFYAGDTQTMRTMERGRTFLNADPDELAADVRQMNRSEKESFRLGALQNLQDEFDASPETANAAYRVMKNQKRKKVLRLTFPDGEKGQSDFDVFINNLNRESGMSVTERAGMNSATAQRTAVITSLQNEIAAGMDINQDNLAGIVFRGLRDKSANAADIQLRSASSELARMLTAENPDTLRKILTDLEGGGNILDILSNVRLNNITPAFLNSITKPGFVGNQSGNLTEALDPQFMQDYLNEDQRRVIAPAQ